MYAVIKQPSLCENNFTISPFFGYLGGSNINMLYCFINLFFAYVPFSRIEPMGTQKDTGFYTIS